MVISSVLSCGTKVAEKTKMQEMNGATQIHFIRQEKKLILDYFRLHDYQYDDVST